MQQNFISVHVDCSATFLDNRDKVASTRSFEYDIIVPTMTHDLTQLDTPEFAREFEKEFTIQVKNDEDLQRKIGGTGYRRFTMKIKSTYPNLPFLMQ